MSELTPRAFPSTRRQAPASVRARRTYDFDPRLIVPDDSKVGEWGAIAPGHGDRKLGRTHCGDLQTYGIDPDLPFAKLSKKHRDVLLYVRRAPARAAKAAKLRLPKKRSEGDEEEYEEIELRALAPRDSSDDDPSVAGSRA